MSDKEILELFLQKDENALAALEEQYKNYCTAIAEKILGDREDAEECWNDVLQKAWNAIPTAKPEKLRLYIGKIARNSAFTMLEAEKAKKRDGGIKLQLDELSECIPAPLFEHEADKIALRDFMNGFVKKLPDEQRRIFVRRYWFCEGVAEIAKSIGSTENRVSLILFRIRKRLKKELSKEGFDL